MTAPASALRSPAGGLGWAAGGHRLRCATPGRRRPSAGFLDTVERPRGRELISAHVPYSPKSAKVRGTARRSAADVRRAPAAARAVGDARQSWPRKEKNGHDFSSPQTPIIGDGSHLAGDAVLLKYRDGRRGLRPCQPFRRRRVEDARRDGIDAHRPAGDFFRGKVTP